MKAFIALTAPATLALRRAVPSYGWAAEINFLFRRKHFHPTNPLSQLNISLHASRRPFFVFDQCSLGLREAFNSQSLRYTALSAVGEEQNQGGSPESLLAGRSQSVKTQSP